MLEDSNNLVRDYNQKLEKQIHQLNTERFEERWHLYTVIFKWQLIAGICLIGWLMTNLY